jgi:mRNA interferase MazF
MRRGDLYLVQRGNPLDPRKKRVYVIVSRQLVIDSRFSTVICAPVYSQHDGFSTQVSVGTEQGLKHDSSIHCDELVSVLKSRLTAYVGRLSEAKLKELDRALAEALDLPLDDPTWTFTPN